MCRSEKPTHSRCWIPIGAMSSILCLVVLCSGQTNERVEGHVFRSDAIGLTYTFSPDFSAKTAREIPGSDTAVERMLLVLWDNPNRAGSPRISLLYDKKVRPADRMRKQIAYRYLVEVKRMWEPVRGVDISPPEETSPAGYPIWRLDLWQPNNSPHFNSAVVIPLADRRILAIQMNAPSRAELDAELDSLKNLRFDQKPSP